MGSFDCCITIQNEFFLLIKTAKDGHRDRLSENYVETELKPLF
jgi:hypothetical protein